MNKTFVGLLLVLVAGVGVGIFVLSRPQDVSAPENTPQAETLSPSSSPSPVEVPASPAPISISPSPSPVAETIKSFMVLGSNYKFSLGEMRVKKGDRVRVTFKNIEGFHDFKIDEFSVSTKQINAGQEEIIEFVASKTGSFEFYCSVGQHRANGMKGTLVVNSE